VTNLPNWILVFTALFEAVLILRAWLAWRGHRDLGQGAPMDLTVVIPLYGWDQGLPDLVRQLLIQRYDAAVQVIVVVDKDHPHVGEFPDNDRLHLLHPPPCPADWHDKVWRMHHGAAAAAHDAVLFMDSDVTADQDTLAYRVRHHSGDFSFCIPLYAMPNNNAERLLAAFTDYSNFTLYKATFAVRDLATAIGPSMLCTADRAFLLEGLSTHRAAMADDHCLGHWFRSQGRRVHLGAEPVHVAKHGASLREVAQQIIRWLMLPRTVTHALMPHAVVALALGSLLNALPPLLVYAGLALSLAGVTSGPAILAAGVLFLLTEGLALVFVEQAYARRRYPAYPWRHVIFVPLAALSQIWLLAVAMVSSRIIMRGISRKVKR